jgi:cell division protein FtsL
MEINREIINLKREIENIENENKLMQIELLSLKSPQRLEKIAKEYEFILPTKFEIIEVEK